MRAPRIPAVLRVIAKETLDDDLVGQAAKVAYYAFTSLFPLILVVLALTGLVGGARAFDYLMGRIEGSVPADTAKLLSTYVAEITNRPQPGLLSLGALLTLWSASSAFGGLGEGLNAVFDVRETRGFFHRQLLALGVALFASVLLVASSVALVAGPQIADALHLGIVWSALRWPVALVLPASALFVVYRLLPNAPLKHARKELAIGAIVGTIGWAIVTSGFRLYTTHFGSYAKTYGAIGAVIVLLLWLYLSAAAVLFGGEVTAVLVARRSAEAPASAALPGPEPARASIGSHPSVA